MEKIFFAISGNEQLAIPIAGKLNAEMGEISIRQFPDGETYLRILSSVKDKEVYIVCALNTPNDKIMPLYFLAKTAKEQGAKQVHLIAPYLAYMRQDKSFNSGESITSAYFATLLSSTVDSLITIDPHLHRRKSLSEIYTIPSTVLHADKLISNWIKNNVINPVLVGPDSESEQWVAEVAKNANAPYIILQKTRMSDKEVQVSIPHLEKYLQHTPVLVDDIISTAKTMIETVRHLKALKMCLPICIGVHAVFAGDSYEELKRAGVSKIITCNTILHPSNNIYVVELLVEGCK
jgi:ribose-phosphate pyrophosphokinase